MNTKIYKDLRAEDILALGELLKNGEVVALPTETVYGLGANGLDVEATAKIYEAKGRPSDNPLILHVANLDDVRPLVTDISETALRLMKAFWPGPLTLTLPKSDKVPLRTTGGLSTVALRCPKNDLCRAIIQAAGVPIAAPSANISGRPSPTTAEDVYRDMAGKISAIVDGGVCNVGIESTVVEVGNNKVTILRPGAITKEMLLQVVDEVMYDPAIMGKETKPKAPGMKYKHYAPNAQMTTYVGSSEAVSKKITQQIRKHEDKKYALILSEETANLVKKECMWQDDLHGTMMVYGNKDDVESLAHHLYSYLLACNCAEVDEIIAEGIDESGLGQAVMNRIAKACNYNIVKV